MRMKLAEIGIMLAAVVAAGGCSPSTESGDNSTGNAPLSQPDNATEPDMPNLVENQSDSTALRPCPEEAGKACTGPLQVRAEGFALVPYGSGNRVAAQGGLVFENRTGGPIRVAILDLPIAVRLDNGAILNAIDSLSGITPCGSDGARCLQETPDRFQTLAPGDSPVRINAGIWGDTEARTRSTFPTVSSATITFQVYSVDASGAGGTLSISLPNVPVRNQLRQ